MSRGTGISVALVVLLLLAMPAASASDRRAGIPMATLGVYAGSAWTNVTGPIAPPAMAGGMMAYSPAAGAFVLFGGWDGEGLNDTWVFRTSTNAWTLLHPASAPATRGDGNFAYDARHDVFLLFGGWHETANETYRRLGDTWAFSLSNATWWELHPAEAPANRSDAGIAFDASAGVLLLFGGFDGTNYLGDAWAFSFANDTWFPRPSLAMPQARADGRIVYDSNEGLLVLYGGNSYSDPQLNFNHLSDTWTYDYSRNLWTEIAAGTPGARDYSVEGFDPATSTVLLVGGFGNRQILSDTWALARPAGTWQPVSTAVSPPPRFAGVGGFDTRAGLLVLFSGLGNGGLRNDTWLLRYVPDSGTNVAPSSTNLGQLVLFGFLGGFFLLLVTAGAVAARRESGRRGETSRGAASTPGESVKETRGPDR